jgi:hypothetical protein
MAAANRGFALWGADVQLRNICGKQIFVFRIKISAKNPPQRKAAKRYLQL